jgi:hypothetical protein
MFFKPLNSSNETPQTIGGGHQTMFARMAATRTGGWTVENFVLDANSLAFE